MNRTTTDAHIQLLRRPPTRQRRDRGAIGGIEVLPFGFLLFVACTLFIANVWAVVDAKIAVAAAAREAVRSYVEADNEAEAISVATRAAQSTLDAYGRGDVERVTIAVPQLDRPFGRCARVTITVQYEVPALLIPWLGGLGDGLTADASHCEVIDPYRSGLTEGGCS